jgi:hypothetical protein
MYEAVNRGNFKRRTGSRRTWWGRALPPMPQLQFEIRTLEVAHGWVVCPHRPAGTSGPFGLKGGSPGHTSWTYPDSGSGPSNWCGQRLFLAADGSAPVVVAVGLSPYIGHYLNVPAQPWNESFFHAARKVLSLVGRDGRDLDADELSTLHSGALQFPPGTREDDLLLEWEMGVRSLLRDGASS